jgi:4-hydroxybenzoate polyprenyltransferase
VSTVSAIVREVRPRQWTKNLIVFAALIFSGNAGDAGRVGRAALAFVAFCLLSGAVYLVNDIADANLDRLHPKKRLRPIAAGELGTRPAAGAAGGGGRRRLSPPPPPASPSPSSSAPAPSPRRPPSWP